MASTLCQRGAAEAKRRLRGSDKLVSTTLWSIQQQRIPSELLRNPPPLALQGEAHAVKQRSNFDEKDTSMRPKESLAYKSAREIRKDNACERSSLIALSRILSALICPSERLRRNTRKRGVAKGDAISLWRRSFYANVVGINRNTYPMKRLPLEGKLRQRR